MKKIKKIGVLTSHHDTFGRRFISGLLQFINKDPEFEWRFPFISEDIDHVDIVKEAKNLDAMIFPIYKKKQLLKVKGLDIPCINITQPIEGCTIPTVTFDNYNIGTTAAKHLLEGDAEEFIYIYENSLLYAEMRWKGFSDTVNAFGLKAQRFQISNERKRLQIGRKIADLSQLIPILKTGNKLGVFTSTDFVGYNVMAALDLTELKCPEDVRVISVNNDEMYCKMAYPHLSSIDLHPERVGYVVGETIKKVLMGESLDKDLLLLPPGNIEARGSSDTLYLISPYLRKAMEFITANFQEGINVKDTVDHLSISRRTLEMQFRKFLNKSIHDVILDKRLEKAKNLLTHTFFTVDDIASRSGFNSEQSFHISFKKATNMTPNEYRALNKLW